MAGRCPKAEPARPAGGPGIGTRRTQPSPQRPIPERPDPQESLRGGLDALEHTSVAVRSMFRSILDLVRRYPEEDGDYARAIRSAFAELLTDLAAAVRAFGTVVRAEVSTTTQPQDESLSAALEKLRLSRSRVSELPLTDPGRTSTAGIATPRCCPHRGPDPERTRRRGASSAPPASARGARCASRPAGCAAEAASRYPSGH